MAGSLKMACHRTSHDSKANEANIDHFDLSFHDLLCVDHLVRVPPEAFDGSRLRLVFAADPPAISDLVEMSKQEGIVDLSCAGFVCGRDCRLIARERYEQDAFAMLARYRPPSPACSRCHTE